MHRMFGILALAMAAWSAHAATAIDLSQAVIQPAPDVPEQVLKFFLKELDEHAPGHHTAVAAAEAKAPGPVISLSIAPEGLQPEGYSIAVVREGGASTVQVRGADARGLLFGVGRLIRVLKLAPDSISVEDDVAITSSPRYRIRGHQLGYRPTANTYDAWDLDTFDRYIRELILFGTNSIELIPALGERGEKTAHMPVPPRKMNAMLSELIHAYGLDVWLWAPVGEDLAQAGAAEEALERRREFYAEMKNIDAVFIPGGDGGNNPIRLLMPFLEQLAPVLHAA
ncbi:MAG: hypothetical protein HYV26_08830, partial [Candidatus Hydrogenedentes bacterium]|nr:hypothetical protein [Candidatus Hydrogenedentota bacterium]